MAIDSDISIANLVTQALKNAGRVSPSSTQISDATAYQFRMVKSNIAAFSGRHDALATNIVGRTVGTAFRYVWPTDAHIIRSVTLLSGPDEWQGTAQTGSGSTITLASTLDVSDSATLTGLYVVLLTGTGSAQLRSIIGWNNSSKVAQVDSAWTTVPDNTTTYMIVTTHNLLWDMDKKRDWSNLNPPGTKGRPTGAAMTGRELWLNHAPDKQYALWWDYWASLDFLDNAGSVILRHIRQHYSLWSQGITAWLCQRYDEDRYQSEMQLFQILLSAYGAEAGHAIPTQFHDV